MAMCKVSKTAHFPQQSSVAGDLEDPDPAHWAPNTDVFQTASGLVIKVELAGIRSEDLQIIVDGHQLRIAGKRPDCCRAGDCKFLVMEIDYGPFENIVTVPKGFDLTRAKASYLNGFLQVDVPRIESAPAKRTKIPINSK